MIDIEHLEKQVADLEAGNERSYSELQIEMEALGFPSFVMDTGDARREIFIDHLVKWEIITEEQKLEFDLAFHKKIDEVLNDTWEKVRERKAQQKKQPDLQVVKRPSKLFGPDGRIIK